MFPNSSYQNQTGDSANLPAVPSPGQQQTGPMMASPAQTPTAPTVTVDALARSAAQARHLVEQFGNDPYKLSESLNQLKSAYLAEQYHITGNQVEH